MFVEIEALGGWGEANASDPATAVDHLTVARAVGREIAERGDPFIADAVGTIDTASGATRDVLARAHADFGRGRLAMKDSPTAAEHLLRNAAGLFAETPSAMTFLALYCVAIALYDSNHPAEARVALAGILQDLPERYRTLRAQSLWQLALADGAAAQWGLAISALNESAVLFDAVGEQYNAAVVRQILSEVYDAIGDGERAWSIRPGVLRELGKTTSDRTQNTVAAISYAAAQAKQWRVAVSMLNVELEIASRIQQGPARADAFIRRAIARHHLQQQDAAIADLQSARAVTASMNDTAYRSKSEADILAAEALISSSPAQSVAKLTSAIEFNARDGRKMYLPALYLQRGRAQAAAGDPESARRDYENGIARLERDRETLPDVPARFGVFDAAEELFVAAIDDALARGDVDSAFDYAERARARTLLDTLTASGTPTRRFDRTAIAPNVAIVEFVSLANDTIAFVATHEGVDVARLGVEPVQVSRQGRQFRERLSQNDAAGAAPLGRSLYSRLISPLALRGKTDLVFITNRETAAIPFAALRSEDGRYLFESYIIRSAPSAATYLSLRPVPALASPHALVIAASSPRDGAVLAAADREARGVAALYPGAALLTGDEGTVAAFKQQAGSANLIHFAGHGLSTADSDASTTLLMSSSPDGIDALTLRDIETLHVRNTSLVVLAACNSARGEEKWSEGTLSVARAFMAAGVPTVIATLWKIDDDQAAEFFPIVHTHMAEGMPPAVALREAQRDWLRVHAETSMIWAAVQSIGR
jgi:CHAT domain-containing protein